MSRRLVGKKMTSGASTSASPTGSVQRNTTEGTRSDDDEMNMAARVLIDIANGSGHHNREQVGPSNRAKRNARKPIWMKDYVGDTEDDDEMNMAAGVLIDIANGSSETQTDTVHQAQYSGPVQQASLISTRPKQDVKKPSRLMD